VTVLIVYEGRIVADEYAQLQGERQRSRLTEVVGYPGIQPVYSFAQPPKDWFRTEGPDTLFWSGWRHGVGHTWFRVAKGDVDPGRVSQPFGRDIQRAIDTPVVELADGKIWQRVPDEAIVFGARIGSLETAYPMIVLDKVGVVNDTVGEQPFLVTYNNLADVSERVAVYESVIDGNRVTMGSTGLSHDQKPLLYDRGTESLWVADGQILRALSGHHKGSSLKLVQKPSPNTWGQWRYDHPNTRLVVGADRKTRRPPL